MCLKLVNVQETDDTCVPFILRRLIGREYHIGPDGITIGTSANCNIRLPVEGDIIAEHCRIKYTNSSQDEEHNGSFVLEDLTGGLGTIHITHNSSHTDYDKHLPATLFHGVRFVTGKLVWDLVAHPLDLLITIKLFHLAEHGDLSGLMNMLESPSPPADQTVPKLTITGTKKSYSLYVCVTKTLIVKWNLSNQDLLIGQKP